MNGKNWLAQSKRLWHNFSWASGRSINSLKTAIACLIGYLVILYTPLPQSQWIVVTILVVMSAQTTLGGVLIKSYMRFWGTVAGALISVLTLLFFSVEPVIIGAVLFIAVLFFAYIAGSPGDVSAAGTLGAVTVAMVLLTPKANISTAEIRFLEITLGIVLAFAVSKFVFPIRAQVVLLRSFADTLLDLRQHFDRCWTLEAAQLAMTDLELDEKITKAFPLMRKLIHETEFELKKNNPEQAYYQRILTSEIKIYRAINMLYYSEHSSAQTMRVIEDLTGLDNFKQQVSLFLLHLSETIQSKKAKQLDFMLANLLHYMETEFKNVVQHKEYEHIAAVNTFLFAAKLLAEELRKLAEAVVEIHDLECQ